MLDPSHFDPTGRFTGLADIYARHRPSYPDAAIERIIEFAGLSPSSLLVDVGAGTGISARQFARRGVPVIGVEPNEEMRNMAAVVALPAGIPAPTYRDGTAEATGLPDASASAVLAAQAFHWFDPVAALGEFHRILRPDGAVALLWNERDESDSFTAAYGDVFRTTPDAAAIEGARGQAGTPLLHTPLFRAAVREIFSVEQVLDEEGVLGRAFSASYAPREPAAAEAFARGLRDVFAAFQHNGTVTLHYETTLYLARRA